MELRMRKPTAIVTSELCHYGCGNMALYKNGSNKLMCANSASSCPENKKKNSSGLRNAYKIGRLVPARDRYSSLPKESKDKMAWNRGKYNADFTLGGKGAHKAVLLQERGYQCESCGLSDWLGDPIPLELEHCDGNNQNNVKDNLLLLCPNCHAKTKFYRGKNIPNHGLTKVTDDQLVEAINKGINNRQVLLSVGLTPKGGNYDRVNRLRASIPK